MEHLQVKRDYAVDLGRFAFAFLVVTLHMPMFANQYLLPLARCAVPFFYLVSGYYMFKPDERKFSRSIVHNGRKWLKLYVSYMAVFMVVSCVLKLFVPGNGFDWTYYDTICLLREGVSPFIDQVNDERETYGITTLWFLYEGVVGMLIVYILKKRIGKTSTLLGVFLLYIITVSVNHYFEDRIIPRFLTASFPAFYAGVFIHCHYDAVADFFRRYKHTLLLAGFFVLYGEYITKRGGYNEIYHSTLPFTCKLFLFMKTNECRKATAMSKIPVKCTLDIYVWHRLVYFLVCLSGWHLGRASSVVVFFMVFAVSFGVRKQMERLRVFNRIA